MAIAEAPATTEVKDVKDQVASLYEAFEKLADAGDAVGTMDNWYRVLLDAVQGDPKVKTLAAQFVPRFYKHFPSLADVALNAQLDLCEDDNTTIRMHAISGLAEICKGAPETVSRVADVLGQLLPVSEGNELTTVKRTFSQLFHLDPKSAFEGLFGQMKPDDLSLRKKCIEFLLEQINHMQIALSKEPELQKHVADGIKRVLGQEGGVNEEEFHAFLGVLRSIKLLDTDPHMAQEILSVMSAQAGTGKDFEV